MARITVIRRTRTRVHSNNVKSRRTRIRKRDAKEVWGVMNEVMEMLRTTQPNIYDSVIRRLIKLN